MEEEKIDLNKVRQYFFNPSEKVEGIEIKGYDFNGPFDFQKFIDSYISTGFQATHVKEAVDIIKKMREEEDIKVFLGYTSNMVSSGLREIIAWLVKNKFVDVVVTTAGGIEEDIIKSLKPFVLGEWHADGVLLRKKGINRIGNIYVPDDNYVDFEEFMKNFLEKILKMQKSGHILSPSEFCYELGNSVNDENSILYWASKNKIPVFCPALTDGSIGDMIYFFKHENPELKVDITDDIVKIANIAIKAKKTGVVILGGSLPKHHVINANLFRGGTDYAIYISTGTEGDGSVGGARPDEAKSWGKATAGADTVHIEGDATIIFPLIVAAAYKMK